MKNRFFIRPFQKRLGNWNLRKKTLLHMIVSSLLLVLIVSSGFILSEDHLTIHLQEKNSSPTWKYPFGTDWLGRNMLARTLKGLTLSFIIGVFAAFFSTLLAIFLSFLSSWSQTLDMIIRWLIDLFLSVPHLVTLILISFALGGNIKGVVISIALTHWPRLTRVLRAEILQIKTASYVQISEKLGKSKIWIARNHYLPQLIPQILVGFILLFPHAILHEASITFLGFGLPQEQPAIGIILEESMRYLSVGMWWLAFFPGLALVILVGLFDWLGNSIRKMIDPFHMND